MNLSGSDPNGNLCCLLDLQANRYRSRIVLFEQGGDWDYKGTYGWKRGDAIGNFNYGATGLAIGLDPITVLRGGGWAQGGKIDPSWGTPGNIFDPTGGTEPSFGDDPPGFHQVLQGELWYTFCSK